MLTTSFHPSYRKLKKRHGSGSATPSGEKAHGDDEDDALTRSIQEGAKNMAGLSIDDEDDWAEDMSPAAIAARQSELASDAVKKMTGSVEDPYEDFAAYIEENPDALPKEIKDEADRLSISDDKACAIMMQVLFNASIDKGEIEAKSPILELFVSSGEKAQKGLLGGLERLCGEMFPKVLLDKVPVLLMALYEADLVEEDVFIAWYICTRISHSHFIHPPVGARNGPSGTLTSPRARRSDQRLLHSLHGSRRQTLMRSRASIRWERNEIN